MNSLKTIDESMKCKHECTKVGIQPDLSPLSWEDAASKIA
jgi:hypothetical protein